MPQRQEDQYSSPTQEKEWIKQIHVIYGGLIAVGLVMIQPFLYKGEFVGLAAEICVYSFSLSIPMLAALLLLNHEEEHRKHFSQSKIATMTRVIAQLAAFVGLVAGFWHIHMLAGVGILVGAFIGMCAYSAGYTKLYMLRRGNKK